MAFDERVPDFVYFSDEGTVETEEYYVQRYHFDEDLWETLYIRDTDREAVKTAWVNHLPHAKHIYRVIRTRTSVTTSIMEWDR